MGKDLLIGIDIGGTDTKIGVIDTDGCILRKTSIETQPQNSPETLAERIFITCRELLEQKGILWKDVIVAGIGAPGILDIKKGIIEFSPNIRDWVNVSIVNIIQKRLNLRCILENDANVAAFGEKWMGAGKGAGIESLVMFTLGTGIGGGIVLGNEIWHGCNNAAGELGHITLEPNGVKCGCGNFGCLEVYASATGVTRRYKEASNFNGLITAKGVYNKATEGDEIANRIMYETGVYLGIAIVNIMHTLNPDIIVIGGGMAAAKDVLINPIQEEIKKRSYKAARERTNVIFGKLGNDAGIIGAAGWALKILEISV